jgi:hypothetical protein
LVALKGLFSPLAIGRVARPTFFIAFAAGLILTGFYLWRRDLVANMIGHGFGGFCCERRTSIVFLTGSLRRFWRCVAATPEERHYFSVRVFNPAAFHPNAGPVEHVRVNHRRADGFVTKEFLHGADIVIVFQ